MYKKMLKLKVYFTIIYKATLSGGNVSRGVKFYVEGHQGYSWDGPEPFSEKTNYFKLKWILFLAAPHI